MSARENQSGEYFVSRRDAKTTEYSRRPLSANNFTQEHNAQYKSDQFGYANVHNIAIKTEFSPLPQRNIAGTYFVKLSDGSTVKKENITPEPSAQYKSDQFGYVNAHDMARTTDFSRPISAVKYAWKENMTPVLKPSAQYKTDRYGCVNVYIKGICKQVRNNESSAYIGVWFENNSTLNLSRNDGQANTSNVAVMLAAASALQVAKQLKIVKLNINSDLEYLVNGMNNSGWLFTKKKLANREYVKDLFDLAQGIQVFKIINFPKKWLYTIICWNIGDFSCFFPNFNFRIAQV